MKKYQVLPLIIFCFFLGITKNVQAEDRAETKNGHIKPAMILNSAAIKKNKAQYAELDSRPEKTPETTINNTGEEKTWPSPGSIKSLAPSLAPSDTDLLTMEMYYGYIIAAAVQKDPDNVSVQGTFKGAPMPLINFYYDSLGNLDYATTVGFKVADVYYCDGTEGYNCPKGWMDYITFNAYGLNPAFDLDFYYTSDTPNTNYYAQAPNEPALFFYNINMADGTKVSAGDALYFGDGFAYAIADLPLPLSDPNWSLWFDTFDGSRLSIINNENFTATATFTESTSNSIYRFWSNSKQHHFFTISKPEKNSIITNDSSWSYEGVAYKGYATQLIGTTAVYRFWSNSKQGHFFTASAAEKNSIIANDHSWAYEGIAYYAYATEQPSSTAVYRFWSNSKQGHFFTISAAEKDSIIANDHSWNYEGIAWYVPTS